MLGQPEKSARQLAWLFTDQEGYCVSESSVFRLLKRFDLVESPPFQLVTAADRFAHSTRQVNELWQTDFTYFKVPGDRNRSASSPLGQHEEGCRTMCTSRCDQASVSHTLLWH